MKRIVASGGAALAGLLVLATAALASSGITNGSFEANGPAQNDWWWHVWGPSNAVQGWTVPAGKSVDLVAAGTLGWQASTGIHSIDLDGDWPGAIQQTVSTAPGTFYLVRFDMSGNPDPYAPLPTGWSEVKGMRVSATGSGFSDFSYDTAAKGNTHSDMKYEAHSYLFQASGANTALEFTSLSAGNSWWGPVLDNVRLDTATKDDCKKGGWATMGSLFKNQGDCVSFIATGGKNSRAGR